MPQNCILAGSVSVRFADAILRNDDIYTRRRDLTFEFSPFSFQFSLFSSFVVRVLFLIPARCWSFSLHSDVTISLPNNHSAGINFNTCVVVGIGVSGAVCGGLYAECA